MCCVQKTNAEGLPCGVICFFVPAGEDEKQLAPLQILTHTMGCLDDVLSLDGTLDKRGRQKRTLFFFMCLGGFVVQMASSIEVWMDLRGRYFYCFFSAFTACTYLCAIMMALCKVKITTPKYVFFAYSSAVTILWGDLTARAAGNTVWPILVLIVDYLLVMEVPSRYSMGVVCFAVVYFVVMSLEEGFRFGILDIPGIMPQEERAAYMAEACQCTKLPCPTNTANYKVIAVAVFVADFLLTRGFAYDLRKEQESMERTINTVQEIASLLAGYDVEQVAELLKVHGGDLPEGMTVALRRLEENLRVYKAYLPQTCLPFDNAAESDAEQSFSESMSAGDEAAVSMEKSASSALSAVLFQTVHLQQLGLLSAKVTLLTVNVKDTLIRLVEDSACFSDLFTTLLLKTLQGTETRRGMVDVFIGDRIHCSFNASKQCASHATSALHTATLLIRGGVTSYANMGVATGKVLRGDMGCEVMRRFSMVGELVRDVNGLERVGRMLGCDVVCNRMCFSDAECEHQLRLLPCKVEVASGCEAQVVAELIVSEEEETAETADEWMYMIGGKKDWEEYNITVRGYLRGEQSDLDVAMAWSAAGGLGTPAHAVPSGTCSVVCCYIR